MTTDDLSDAPHDGSHGGPVRDAAADTVRNARREAMRAAARKPSQALRRLPDLARRDQPAAPPRAQQPATRTRVPRDSQLPVFFSYAHADMEIVRREVLRLRNAGLAVTWDQDFLGGSDFEQEIRRAIDAAGAVIAVWSAASVASPFVKDEARRAMAAGKLVTTHIDGLDFKDIPLGFGHLHVIALSDHDRVARSLVGLIGDFEV